MRLHHFLSAITLGISPIGTDGYVFPKLFGGLLTKGFREATEIEVIEGVGLPTDTKNMPIGTRLTNLVQGSIKTNRDVVSLVISDEFNDRLDTYLKTVPKPLSKTLPDDAPPVRHEAVRSLFTWGINNVIKVDQNDPDPTDGYLYFGNNNFKKILPMLCQTNPFYASALTASEDGEHLELISFVDHPERVDEPLYLSLMREMVDDVHRINVKFDKSMNIVEISKLDNGKGVVVPEEEWDYYASGVLYNLFYHASTIHANIHILHYLMCTCIIQSTRDTNKSMEKWADIYDDNIAIKYVEVAGALFDSTFRGKSFGSVPEDKLVSGQNGFGATSKVMKKVKDMQFLWGSLKTTEEFTKKFLLKGVYMTAKSEENAEKLLAEANILTEFNKHRDNVPRFAEDLTAAMDKDDAEALKKTNKKIKSFMAACGRGVSSIDSVSSWLQLMCMTGLVHGSTLSYTRLILLPEIMRWRNIHEPEWSHTVDEDTKKGGYDSRLMLTGFGTLQGMTEDRHIFTSKIEHGYKWETEDIADGVKAVLDEYDEKAKELKESYTKELQTRDDLREYGWILTDHCPDGYDGKQHTITTYI